MLVFSTDYLCRTDNSTDYSDLDLIAKVAVPMLDEFDEDIKRAVQFQNVVAVGVSKQSKSETQKPKNVIEKPVSVCETPKTVLTEPQAAPENKAMILQGAKILAEQIATKQEQAGEDESNIFDDSIMAEAIALIVSEEKVSTALLQRRLSIGYGRAAKIIDALEVCGFVSPPDGNKPRNVFITKNDLLSALNEEK